MDQAEIAKKLREYVVKNCGSQKVAAAKWEVSPALVSGVLRGERRPTTSMLDSIGYEVANLSPSYVKKGRKK